jgi:hypothetical protein
VQASRVKEDVSFRRARVVPVEEILEVVALASGVATEALLVQQRNCRWRAVTARMLCGYGGLTQWGTAKAPGIRTGGAVSCQLRRLTKLSARERHLQETIGMEARLSRETS